MAHARTMDPETSHQAASRITDECLSEIQLLVLIWFRKFGPMTDLDLQRHVGTIKSTYRTRRAELVAIGMLRDSGRRATQDGSKRIIWELVP
jgi:hypothetical protein